MTLHVDPRNLPPFTRQDREVASLLEDAGMEGRTARVLVYLRKVPEARSRDLQRELDLRQPEVSVVTQDLRDREWVVAEPRNNGGKGRPLHHYRLETDWDEVLGALESRLRERFRRRMETLRRLRELLC